MSQNLDLRDIIQQGELPPHSNEKNVVSQINRYNRWLVDNGRRLYQPKPTHRQMQIRHS